MALTDWQTNGWLRPHKPDAASIGRLLGVIERDVRAGQNVATDPDWRFAAAYNAALQAATAALNASGYDVPKGGAHHHRAIESLQFTFASDAVDELQAFRAKRGGTMYESVGIASETELEQLCLLAASLQQRLIGWLRQVHPSLAPPPPSAP